MEPGVEGFLFWMVLVLTVGAAAYQTGRVRAMVEYQRRLMTVYRLVAEALMRPRPGLESDAEAMLRPPQGPQGDDRDG